MGMCVKPICRHHSTINVLETKCNTSVDLRIHCLSDNLWGKGVEAKSNLTALDLSHTLQVHMLG